MGTVELFRCVLMFSSIKCWLGPKASLHSLGTTSWQAKAQTLRVLTSHERERHAHQQKPVSLIWHPTDVGTGLMNEHYHLDSGSFVKHQVFI